MGTQVELPEQRKQGRILLIRGGAIGDFILTLPVLAALRNQFPQNRLEVLGYPHISSLAVAGGVADAVRPIEARAMAGFFAKGGDLDFELSSYFASFHLILSYLFDPDFIFQSNITRISKAQFIQGPHRPDEHSQLHATEQLLQPLTQLVVFDADSTPRMVFPRYNPAVETILAVHPGSGSDRKNWPESGWGELLSRLTQTTQIRFLLLGGEAEGTRLDRLSARLPSARVEVLRSRPLPEVAERLAHCHGFVGHDSGITHLAAAVGLPGVVLWGPTQSTVWSPRSPHIHRIEAGDALDQLPVQEVFRSLQQHLPRLFNGPA